jgi:DNA helicase-2/ATP-dependent DNA helicase PcrA
MTTFQKVYAGLNEAQRRAVDTVYGPVLVVAGPGTGKTQLLSARVAHLLQATDALPHNILCLTFTESGTQNMRERLTSFIGQAAYDVQISTYHAFGSTVIRRFPEYFSALQLERPVDELGKRQLLSEIIEATSYQSPIKQVRHHLGDLIGTISELKRGLLSANDLRALARDNLTTIASTQAVIAETLAPYAARMPSKIAVAEPVFERIRSELLQATNTVREYRTSLIKNLAELATNELELALAQAQGDGSTKPLTAWKNKWLVKDSNNRFMLAGTLEAKRIAALADVLEQYQAKLAETGLYDFDDMILRAIDVLEHNDDLRFTLQEQYQFILLDEFQDTNAAQFRLVQLLTDNPVHEGKPNVLAVGDDDQAIYAFQGAEYSNMLDFYHAYRDVCLVTLEENYRSHAAILETAGAVAGQIESRLHHHFDSVSKNLRAVNTALPAPAISRQSYRSAVAERSAVATHIAQLVQGGVPASQIAVLAPKHKLLEPLVPYLHDKNIPVSYTKRENVLETPVVRELLTMSRLLVALQQGNHPVANSLWPTVLSYDFWGFSTADIWRLSWQANDERKPWSALLLDHTQFKHAALLMLALAGKLQDASLETILDALIGSTDVTTHDRDLPSVRSPLRDYYFKTCGEGTLYETVMQLSVLRARLREHEASENRELRLEDLLAFVDAYRAAEQPMRNTSPYNEASEAVQLMTVYAAKGLEFDHVFLLACDDSVWGSKASGQSNKLTLPANLSPIRHAGATDDERLRLLYVAVTRAKYGLYLSSYEQTFSGRQTEAVKYFDESVTADGTRQTHILPAAFQTVVTDESEPPSLETLTRHWQTRHTQPSPPLRELLQSRLSRYQLSPTHMTRFLDLKYGGPESFLLYTLLRFPTAPSLDASFGNAIHASLQWLQNELNRTSELPPASAVVQHALHYLAKTPMAAAQMAVQRQRAQHTLETYLATESGRFRAGNVAEKSFRDEGVVLGQARLGGAVDLLEIDQAAREIVVVDYKTGHLGSDPAKLHRYTLQLYCYKLLVENSHAYKNYQVNEGRLVFVEPDSEGVCVHKTIRFTDAQTERTSALLQAVWHNIITLTMPDVSDYGDTLKDMLAFENQLLAVPK